MAVLEETIKFLARNAGFDLVGITAAEPSAFAEEYRQWLDRGYAGEMEFLARDLHRRLDPRELLPDARSIIVVGMNYYADDSEGPGTPPYDPERGIFARYARGDDYHEVMSARLKTLWTEIRALTNEDAAAKIYVDTGPILEREAARKAGLGWFGKNTMLINTRQGSYFFLGEIITNLALEIDSPAIGGCGTCTACIDACPTGAIVAPFEIDSRRCISYLTIELKGDIPEDLQPAISESGNRIYGCDICQEVCPFNIRRSTPTADPAYQPREITSSPKLQELASLSEEEFRERFRKSPVKRAKHRGLLRNVSMALAVSDDIEAEVALERAVKHDPKPLVCEHTARAL